MTLVVAKFTNPVHLDKDARVDIVGSRSKPSPRRILAITVVLALHAAIGVVVFRPTSPAPGFRPKRGGVSAGVIDIRFLDRTADGQTAGKTRPVSHAAGMQPSVPRQPPTSALAAASTATVPRPPHTGKRLDLRLPDTGFRVQRRPRSRIGRSLEGSAHRVRPRVPGHGHVHGAPELHLTDPRQQGVAGVIRGIQGLIGAVDSHCVDVDAWRGMTRKERFRHHVSQADIQRVARRHGCKRRQHRALRHTPGLIPQG